MWGPATDPQHFHFNCSWLGAYPSPNLTWVDEGGAGGQLHQWALADSLSLRLNRSELWDGQTLRCRAQHPVLADTDKTSCSFTFSKSGQSTFIGTEHPPPPAPTDPLSLYVASNKKAVSTVSRTVSFPAGVLVVLAFTV